VICLWTCLLTWVQTRHQTTCVNFFSAIRTQNEITEIRLKFHRCHGLHKISEKFFENSFFLKLHPRISTKFETKRDRFQVKQMSIHQRKKSNSFTHKRTFLSVLAVMNKQFIANLVGWIWGSNLSQNWIDTVTNVW